MIYLSEISWRHFWDFGTQGQDRTGQVRSVKVGSGQVRSVRSVKVRSG